MKVSFHGANKEVTGSCILIESENQKFLVDCGMFQGPNSYGKNQKDFNFNPKEIDFILLTHAHLDHVGRIPMLINQGFRGKIISTFATRDLAEIILLDSANIFLKDEKEPLFNIKDVKETLRLFECFDYNEEIILGSVKAIMRDAGHILGSSIFEVFLENKKVIFSGDLGNDNSPIVRDTFSVDSADVVFVESTYGGKIHSLRKYGIDKLLDIIKEIIEKKSVLLIPSFSIEKTQELLYEINGFVENKKISPVKVFLDSPLAIKATDIFEKYENLFDKEALRLIKSGDNIFEFEDFKETESIEQSFSIDKIPAPKIIIAGSGMCSGGRIPYFIKKYASEEDNILLLISYQAEGTIGREIEEGKKNIRINKKDVFLKMRIEKISSFSSHADSEKIIKWIEKINPSKVFIVHGEEEQALALKKKLKIKEAFIPDIEENFEI